MLLLCRKWLIGRRFWFPERFEWFPNWVVGIVVWGCSWWLVLAHCIACLATKSALKEHLGTAHLGAQWIDS